MTGGENNYVCGTFLNVAKGEDGVLFDIKANDAFEFQNDALVLLNPDGTTYKQAYWVSETLAAENEIDPGWYDATVYDESEELVILNDEEVKFGTGFMINCVNEDVDLAYAGQVLNGTQELVLTAGQNNYIGNCTPVDRKLGDIKATDAFEFQNDALVLLNPDGTTYKQAYWVSETLAAENEIDPGWYDATIYDESEELVLLNTEDIPAGLGFMINSVNEGANIIIPSPMAN